MGQVGGNAATFFFSSCISCTLSKSIQSSPLWCNRLLSVRRLLNVPDTVIMGTFCSSKVCCPFLSVIRLHVSERFPYLSVASTLNRFTVVMLPGLFARSNIDTSYLYASFLFYKYCFIPLLAEICQRIMDYAMPQVRF